jgi:hypothetical protein
MTTATAHVGHIAQTYDRRLLQRHICNKDVFAGGAAEFGDQEPAQPIAAITAAVDESNRLAATTRMVHPHCRPSRKR